MNESEYRTRLWLVNREIAIRRYEYYELFTGNRVLAMKLSGYKATHPDRFSESLIGRMQFYIRAGQSQSSH